MGVLLTCLLLTAAPPELGTVRWGRDYPAALREAKTTGRPLLVLFTEVPGCSTVNGYAEDVLSNPVVVDASELFVRVAVFNNLEGADAAVLQRWKEPAWNNPVVRLIDADEHERAPRLTHEGGSFALLRAMAHALGDKAPPWLQAIAIAEGPARAAFAMGCFWEGEAALGALPEVHSTRTGYMAGQEVVQLTAESEQALAGIEAAARARGYERLSGSFRSSDRDDKFQLHGTRFEKLSLTPGQKMRINSALAAGTDALQWLAPSQRRAPE